MHKPVRYLVLIETAGSPLARLFDADQVHILDIDAMSEEVADMTNGHVPEHNATDARWNSMLQSHTAAERREAQVFTLDI